MTEISRAVRAIALAICLLPVAAASIAAGPAADWDGLQRRASKKVTALYVRPGATLQAYNRVRLEPLQVAFAKDWKPNANASLAQKVSARDLDAIRSNLAGAFSTAFTEELARGGYAVVSEADEDVLTVVPFIVDLYISAPKTASTSPGHTFVAEQGRMTLVAELRDSATSQVLARAVDKAVASHGTFEMANAVTRGGAAEDAIRGWARELKAALDEARARAK